MHKSIHDDSIPEWINEHAITTAKRVFQENSNSSSKDSKSKNPTTHFITASSSSRNKKKPVPNDLDHEEDASVISSVTISKKKRKNKNSKKHEPDNDTETSETNHQLPPDFIIPLHDLAKLIGKHYSDFLTIHTNLGYNEMEYDDDIKSWTHDDNMNDHESEQIGPIHYFLQIHLYDYIKTLSLQAYYQEYNQLQALSLQTALNSNAMDISPKMKQKIISSFEDKSCFPVSCHWIQMLDKSFTYLDQHLSSNCDIVVANVQSILAADFAKRITQYCMFIHDIPLNIFSFSHHNPEEKQEKEGINLKQHSQLPLPDFPNFCQPVIVSNFESSSSSQDVFLSCSSSTRDPLQVLREELSDGIGVALARMWIYAGSKHYQQNNTNKHNPNNGINWGSFLLHSESNVYLFTDGIPFKKLDKKVEKKILFERKCTLMQVLSSIACFRSDGEDDINTYFIHAKNIISIVLILLFQQIKHIIITADFLFIEGDSSVDVIELLLKNDKIPEKVRNDIKLLHDLIQEKKEDELLSHKDLVERVKSYGLCRDITKV